MNVVACLSDSSVSAEEQARWIRQYCEAHTHNLTALCQNLAEALHANVDAVIFLQRESLPQDLSIIQLEEATKQAGKTVILARSNEVIPPGELRNRLTLSVPENPLNRI